MKKNVILWIAALAMTGLTACNESDLIEKDCENGEQKCARGSVWMCSENVWELETLCQSSELCNETTFTCDATTATCDDGEKRCQANNVEVCANNAWTIETQCEGSTVCNAITYVCDATVVTCNDGDKRCQANNVEVCANNAWTIETQCEGSTVCNASTYVCDAIVVTCNDGETKCTSDGKLNSCADNQWTLSDCDAGQVCPSNKTACEDKVCDEGSSICNAEGNATIVCIDNALVETACTGNTSLCEAGNCVVCLNGEKRCENNAIEVCEANVWTEELACGEKVCNATNYTCDLVSMCTTGWERCNGNIVEVCDDGQYAPASPAACAAGTYCLSETVFNTAFCVECKSNADCKTTKAPICHSDNTCVACVPFDKKCHESDGSFILCDEDGAWETSGTTCEGGLTCLPGGNDCTPIDGYCANNDDCKDTFHGICRDNRCTCDVGQESCIVEDGQARYSICESWAFGWTPYVNCEASTPVCNGALTQCVECTEDSHCKGEATCDKPNNKCITETTDWDHLVDLEDCIANTSYNPVICTSGIAFTSALHDVTQDINGVSIRMAANSSATITVPDGVGKLSITVKKVFTKTANVTISVGGVTVIQRLGMVKDTLETLTNDTVNASGAVDIVINTTERIVIDDLQWTNYP